MADNRIATRILIRYAPYSQMMASDIILQPGEMAVAAFPDLTSALNPPRAFGVKVGDGTRYFDELPWIQALAADVYNWAKEPTKPTYSAIEIQGLDEYIQSHSSGGGSGGGSGSGNYRIIYDENTFSYILQQYNLETNEWENTSSAINLSTILNRLNTIERWANGARVNLGNIEAPLVTYIYEEVTTLLDRLDVDDEPVEGQVVTAVSQNNGLISVTHAPINMSEIERGVLPTEHGGTGLSVVNEDEVLVGNYLGNITVKRFVTEIDNDRNVFATVGAIKDYVTQQTAGLTGAMHFVGETSIVIPQKNSNVNPQISGYNFAQASPGDVILANNTQEFVWTGSSWRLLGDEGSYAVKGSIKNADIAEDAGISQSKIADLSESFNLKVDKVEGKQLSTNDYTTEEKQKLAEIENGAQVNLIERLVVNDVEVRPSDEKIINLTIPVLTEEQINKINVAEANVIEHIFVNGVEVNPSTINQKTKSIGINFTPFTQEEKTKLSTIESGAEVNIIESISINGREYTPNANKQVEITIDQSALSLNVLEGARYPVGNTYADIDITNKKLELSHLAATGNIDHLIQTSGTYIILDCGSSTDVI